MNIVERLVSLQLQGLPKIPGVLLRVMGLVIPKEVVFEDKKLGGARFVHGAVGTVFHPKTKIGKNVWVFQGVTIGKTYPWNPDGENCGCIIEDDAILCAGAKILFRDDEVLKVGKGTIVAANAVLTQSTGEYEIWAGIPARRVGLKK